MEMKLYQNHKFSDGLNQFQRTRNQWVLDPRSGGPLMSRSDNVLFIRKMVQSDLQLTVRVIDEQLNFNFNTVREI